MVYKFENINVKFKKLNFCRKVWYNQIFALPL